MPEEEIINKYSTARRTSILDKLNALGSKTVEDIICFFEDSTWHQLLPQWITFARSNSKKAVEYCYEMRKKGDITAIISYFLSKEHFNLSKGKLVNTFAWSALEAIKTLKKALIKAKNTSQSIPIKNRIIEIVQELDKLKIDGTSDNEKIILNQIKHYKIVYLSTEDHLSKAFEEQRRKYIENPQDLDNLRQFGWTLHDCIIQSIDGLADKNLVTFFAKELSLLTYPDEMQELDSKLVRCHTSDLQKAKNFLNGIGELRALEKNNELSAALSIAENLFKENSENLDVLLATVRVYEKLNQHAKALNVYLKAHELSPNDEGIQINAAWALVRSIKESLKTTDQQIYLNDKIDKLFFLLTHFTMLSKPSAIYSRLLSAFTNIIKAFGKNIHPYDIANKYLKFVKTWGIENFTPVDYQPFTSKKNKKNLSVFGRKCNDCSLSLFAYRSQNQASH